MAKFVKSIRNNDDVKDCLERYESIGEFMDILAKKPISNAWSGHELSSDDAHDSAQEWSMGIKTFAEAVEFSRTGYEGAVEEMKKYMDAEIRDLESIGDGLKAYMRQYYVGGSPNVVRAMMGLPKDMRQLQKQPSKVKTVEITYGCDFACGVSSQTVLRNGAKVLAIVDTLERLGYSVRLNVSSANEVMDCFGGYSVALKNYREPLDLQKIAFPFAHSAFFRKIGFRWIETFAGFKTHDCCYGTIRNNLLKQMPEYCEANDGKFISFDDAGSINVRSWLTTNGFLKEVS